jgi:Ras-related protein Rab-5C
MYYRDANAALVVFDLLEADTFKIAKQWVKDLRKDCTKNCIIAMAGNKVDLVESGKQRQVQLSEVQQYCQENSIIYFDVSAKTGKNVDTIFQALAEKHQQVKMSLKEDKSDPSVLVVTPGTGTNPSTSGKTCSC